MVLLTKRLTIQQYTQSDFDHFAAILTNDTIMKGIRGEGYSFSTALEKFEEALLVNKKNRQLGFFNVTMKDTHDLVGFAKLVVMGDTGLEVGYALAEHLWGFGYASEITAALVDYAQNTFPEKEIIGIVNADNEASKNVLRKQNFKLKDKGNLDGFEVVYFYLSK